MEIVVLIEDNGFDSVGISFAELVLILIEILSWIISTATISWNLFCPQDFQWSTVLTLTLFRKPYVVIDIIFILSLMLILLLYSVFWFEISSKEKKSILTKNK